MNRAPEIELERVSAAYEIRVRAALGGDLPEELRLRDRLDPAHWALEWNLAGWLGQAFGLEARLTDEICLSNVLGLASIRLRDDLADGEMVAAGGPLSATQMADRLHEAAVEVYGRLFEPASVFWTQLDLRMTEWHEATIAAAMAGPDAELPLQAASSAQLAKRGAPLKISAFAVCLLAVRRDQFPAIDRCLDHALTAMVLYDHLVDWREDLAAGRWNAFVAASVPAGKPTRATGPDVQLAMMTTDAIDAYFEVISDELDRAATLASGVGVRGLATHLEQTAADLDRQGRDLAARYREISERAHQLLFGNQPPLAA